MQQACAIPFRRADALVEFCLITTSGKGTWSFPKGIIDPGETAAETALKESFEEAGLRGTIVGPPLGSFAYHKWETTLEVTVWLMHVTEAAAQWPESSVRQRRWAELSEARGLLERDALRELLDRAAERIGEHCDRRPSGPPT
ncbi:MAG: NUDIX hydrolase [Pirellulaceae bacterium]|nr:NUDIX hydrolase [Pirellulaceae bacterium]